MKGTLIHTLGSQAQYAHSLEDHTRSIQQSTSTHTKHFHNIQQQNNNHTYCELFHQTIHKQCKHTTHKTNRSINRATHNIQGYKITLTTAQVQEAIKQSKNNNALLTSMLKTALNTNIIPQIWKLANIVPIQKPKKDIHKGTSYRPISLFSVIVKTLEKSLLIYITASISDTLTQHGYKTQHSTVTALHTLNNTVEIGSNKWLPVCEQSL